MKRTFNMALIIVVCALLGVVTDMIINQLYTNGIFIDEIITASETITINDLLFIVFFAWLFTGIVIGILRS